MYLQNLVNNLPSMIGCWDKNLCNIFCNDAYYDFFQKTPGEIKGKHIRELLGEELFKKNYPYMERALKGEKVSFEREIPILGQEPRYTQAEYIPLKNEHGEIQGFYVLVTDITHLKQIEKEKEDLYQKLVQNSKMAVLGEMAGGIAHEINNPLSILSMNISILQAMTAEGKIEPEKYTKILSTLQLTTDRIAKIVSGLLHFAREAGEDPFVFVTVKSILEEALSFCLEKLKKRNIAISISDYDEELGLECSPVQISQVLLNLISNAADAIEFNPEKKIKIDVQDCGHAIEIRVIDSGHGINEKIADKIMRPFFTTKDPGKGTGLGLSISKGIIEKHHGAFYLDLKAKNTTFVISLPKLHSQH